MIKSLWCKFLKWIIKVAETTYDLSACCCGTPGSDCSTGCDAGTAPAQWKVTVAGFTDGHGFCSECSGVKINKDWICDRRADPGAGICLWDSGLVFDLCSVNRRLVEVILTGSNIAVKVYTGTGITQFQVAYPSGPPMNCLSILSLNVPRISDTGQCDGSAATVHLSRV